MDIIEASDTGDIARVRSLLDDGVDVNICDNTGNTALTCASRHRRTDIVRILLTHGAKVNIITVRGRTALMCASNGGCIENVRLLLSYGADVTIQSYRLFTAITGTPICYSEIRQLLQDSINMTWNDGVLSLTDMCVCKIKSMRSEIEMIDGVPFVDQIPDMMIAKHFADWEGTDRWLCQERSP